MASWRGGYTRSALSCTDDVMIYTVIIYDAITYGVMTYDVIMYDVMIYDIITYDIMKPCLFLNTITKTD